MGKEKLTNLLLVLVVILIIIGIPYLLYSLGSLVQIDSFGYINNWWIVLAFLILLIAIFILGSISFDKNMGYFFLVLWTVPFFLLGMQLGVKPNVDQEAYALLMEKEQEIENLDAVIVKLESDLAQLEEETSQSSYFKNHEIIFFEPGNAKLSDYNKDRITAFVSTLENCKLTVNGYSDDSGEESFNVDISKERAQHVADFIQSIDQQNNTVIKVNGFGIEDQLVENNNESGRSKNRRVTIEIVGMTDLNVQKSWSEISKMRTEIGKISAERDSLRALIYHTE